jgi:hypothetical protein
MSKEEAPEFQKIWRNCLLHYPFSNDAVFDISNNCDTLIVEKGEYFCTPNSFGNRFAILVEGLMVSKYKKNEEEMQRHKDSDYIYTEVFYPPENIYVYNHGGFDKGTKATETIEAIEDSRLIFLTDKNLLKLENLYPELIIWEKHNLNDCLAKSELRLRILMLMENKDRIFYFDDANPGIIKRLGITVASNLLDVNRNLINQVLPDWDK